MNGQDVSIYWELPVLLVVFSLVYSGTRHDRWDRILWEAVGWGGRVAFFLGTIGATLYVLSNYPDYQWVTLGVIAALTLGSFVMSGKKG